MNEKPRKREDEMRYEIEIQRHQKVSDFLGYNDMVEKSQEEKEAALALYKTQKWEIEMNGGKIVYVAAFDLDSKFIGGMYWANDKVGGYSHTLEQHKNILEQLGVK